LSDGPTCNQVQSGIGRVGKNRRWKLVSLAVRLGSPTHWFVSRDGVGCSQRANFQGPRSTAIHPSKAPIFLNSGFCLCPCGFFVPYTAVLPVGKFQGVFPAASGFGVGGLGPGRCSMPAGGQPVPPVSRAESPTELPPRRPPDSYSGPPWVLWPRVPWPWHWWPSAVPEIWRAPPFRVRVSVFDFLAPIVWLAIMPFDWSPRLFRRDLC